MAEQFAKEISSEKDYYITARYSNQLLKKKKQKALFILVFVIYIKGLIMLSPRVCLKIIVCN